MSVFDDELLPQYVGKTTYVQTMWPVLFSLTEDGIVCILHVHVLYIVYVVKSVACNKVWGVVISNTHNA